MEKLFEAIKLSFSSIKTNKLRSALTMLGVIIGVSSVILLTSIGSGLKNYLNQQFEMLGSNTLVVLPGNVGSEEGGLGGFQGPPNIQGSKLTLDHVKDLGKQGEAIVAAAPIFEISTKTSFRKNSTTSTLVGTTENYAQIRNLKIEKGRGLEKIDIDGARKVAVIGPSLVEKLFGTNDPLGQDMTIGSRRFQIIGTAEKIGSMLGFDIDNAVYIPITTAQKVIGFENLMQILIKVSSKDKIDQAKDQIKSYFLKQMTKDDFSILNQQEILKVVNQILSIMTIALGGIAAISLLVGGIGIMNIMLVSVTERTREIGLRKAIGATPRAILNQFLIEAVILSCGGGLIGIIVGGTFTFILGRFIPTALTIWSVILAFMVSASVGIIFGVAPAIRASRLNPINALRYE